MVLFPTAQPALDAFHVLIEIIGAVTLKLLDDVLVKCITGFLQKDLHNFRVKILLELRLWVIAC